MDNALINTVEGDDYPESLLFFVRISSRIRAVGP
jgi:hypothetical protein